MIPALRSWGSCSPKCFWILGLVIPGFGFYSFVYMGARALPTASPLGFSSAFRSLDYGARVSRYDLATTLPLLGLVFPKYSLRGIWLSMLLACATFGLLISPLFFAFLLIVRYPRPQFLSTSMPSGSVSLTNRRTTIRLLSFSFLVPTSSRSSLVIVRRRSSVFRISICFRFGFQ